MKKVNKNRFVAIVATVAIVTMFTMNIRYSLSGYGIESVSLHPEVIAQTNGTGTGGGSGSESGGSGSGSESGNGSGSGSGSESGTESGSTTTGPLWDREDSACEYKFHGAANATITIAIGLTLKLNGDGYATYSVPKGCTNCTSGGNEQCTARYCPTLPSAN